MPNLTYIENKFKRLSEEMKSFEKTVKKFKEEREQLADALGISCMLNMNSEEVIKRFKAAFNDTVNENIKLKKKTLIFLKSRKRQRRALRILLSKKTNRLEAKLPLLNLREMI